MSLFDRLVDALLTVIDRRLPWSWKRENPALCDFEDTGERVGMQANPEAPVCIMEKHVCRRCGCRHYINPELAGQLEAEA